MEAAKKRLDLKAGFRMFIVKFVLLKF
jgi:hypothetical protein